MTSPFIVLLCVLLLPVLTAQAVETLGWTQCLAEAARRLPELRSADEAVRQAEAERKIVRGGALPSVNASAGAERSGSTDQASGGSWSYGVNARQLLFDGAKTSGQVSAASQTLEAARRQRDEVSASARYALREAFVHLLIAQRKVSLADEIAVKRRQNLRLIDLLYTSGREHIGSLSKARADLAEAEFEVSQARRGIELAQVVMNTRLGRNESRPIRVTGQFTPEQTTTLTPDFDKIVRNSPLWLAFASRKEAARFNFEVSKSVLMPSLYLSVGAGNGAFNGFPPGRTDWQAGFDLSVPVYSGGSGRARVVKARAAFDQFVADEQSLYASLIRSVQEVWKAYLDAAGYVEVQQNYLNAASERARIADAQYSAGLVSFNDWTIIEDNLVSAKKSYLNARSSLLIAEAAWIEAKGGTLESR